MMIKWNCAQYCQSLHLIVFNEDHWSVFACVVMMTQSNNLYVVNWFISIVYWIVKSTLTPSAMWFELDAVGHLLYSSTDVSQSFHSSALCPVQCSCLSCSVLAISDISKLRHLDNVPYHPRFFYFLLFELGRIESCFCAFSLHFQFIFSNYSFFASRKITHHTLIWIEMK